MNDKIPTAEEFMKGCPPEKKEVSARLVAFAKLHVKAALEAAADNSFCEDTYIGDDMEVCSSWNVNEESILNAYPEENIK